MSRSAIIVIILILCIAGGALLLRQGKAPQDGQTQAERISVTGYREDGTTAWSIQAQSGALDTINSSLRDVELTLLGNPDSPMSIHADRLTRDSAGSQLLGSIRIDQADGLSLTTEALFWDEYNDVLESGPVVIEMDETSITAGAFHHNLNTGLTVLSQGIEARFVRDKVVYTAQSSSAEATSELVALNDHVTVESDQGDHYTCLRLESETSTSTVRLYGGVAGQWQQNEFTAETALLDHDGIRLHGNVTIDLDLLMMGASHDS